MKDMKDMDDRFVSRRVAGSLVALIPAFVVGCLVGGWWTLGSHPPVAQAMAALADQTFVVCTAPVDNATEGLFILDFETGDLTGGVLAPTGKFASTYRHNVLEDLGVELGRIKNPRFMLVPGVAKVGGTSQRMASSVLYVTDAATGVTVAYGIPQAGKPPLALIPLDVAKPRGGGPLP